MHVTVLVLECAPNMYNLQVFLSALTKGAVLRAGAQEAPSIWSGAPLSDGVTMYRVGQCAHTN